MYKSKKLFDRNLYGNIIYNMLNMEEYLKFLNQSDATVLKALEVLEAGESFPQAPEQKPEEAYERTEKAIAKADQRSQKPAAERAADDDIYCFA